MNGYSRVRVGIFTGTRIRSLPISIEKVLVRESTSPRTSPSLDAIAAATVGAHHDEI
jgi:hypothetical protein